MKKTIDLIQQGRKAPAGPYHAPREYINEGVLTYCGDILPEYTIHYSGGIDEVTCTACLEQIKRKGEMKEKKACNLHEELIEALKEAVGMLEEFGTEQENLEHFYSVLAKTKEEVKK